MISGSVYSDFEAIVPLTIRSSVGNKQAISFVVDTGFNGALTLTPTQAQELDLVWIRRGVTTLANDEIIEIDVHVAFVEWNGTLRSVYVEIADTDPLMGMRLLQGNDLFMEAVAGGKVTITTRS